MTRPTLSITTEEARAIQSLRRLAKKWPESLRLFSWSGTLCVTKRNSNDIDTMITNIEGIPNDGGDPQGFSDSDGMWIDTKTQIEWPNP